MVDPKNPPATESLKRESVAPALSAAEATSLLAKGVDLQDKLGPRVARMMSVTEDDLKVRSR